MTRNASCGSATACPPAGVVCALFALSSAVGASAAEVVRVIRVDVPPAAAVTLELPSGSIEIGGTDGDELTGEVRIRCRDDECPERVREAAFAADTTAPDRVVVSMSPDGMNAYRNVDVDYVIRIPRSRDVELDIGAGDVEVRGLRGCVSGRMFAGDWRLSLPLWSVASVHLASSVGDASLRLPGDTVAGERSWLVGAKVDWESGTGACDVRLRLRFGDLQLELEEDEASI